MTGSGRYRKNGQIISRMIDGVPVLVDPYRRTFLKLNPVASRIWELLDGERTVAGVIEALGSEFDADAATIEKDTRAFLKELFRREMIE